MTRSFIRRIFPRLKTFGPVRPPSTGLVVARKAPVFTLPPSEPWKDPAIRPHFYTALGIGVISILVLEHYYPTPPSHDVIFVLVVAKVAWDAVKGQINHARGVKAEPSKSSEAGAKAGASQAS